MNIAVISGSTREGSQSLKVANILVEKLKKLGAETTLIDLHASQLPLFDDSAAVKEGPVWQSLKPQIEQAEGFVFVSPEWDGMFSVGLHNMFHYALNLLGHKPVMLVGVSNGKGGAYPLSQMKMIGPKNTHYVVSPENLRVMDADTAVAEGEFTEKSLNERSDYCLKILLEYSKALKQVRDTGLIDYERFTYGV